MNQQTRTHIFIATLNAVPTGYDKAETADVVMDVAAAITGDKIDPRKELTALRAKVEALEAENTDLREQLASLPYANALDIAIGKLENIGALTAEVARLREALEFVRDNAMTSTKELTVRVAEKAVAEGVTG